MQNCLYKQGLAEEQKKHKMFFYTFGSLGLGLVLGFSHMVGCNLQAFLLLIAVAWPPSHPSTILAG